MNPINETELIMSEMLIGFSDIELTKYVNSAFILIGILLIVLVINLIINNVNRR